MKAHLAKVSLALLSTAFLLGCQERGSEPVGPEGLEIQAKKGGGGGRGGGDPLKFDVTVSGPDIHSATQEGTGNKSAIVVNGFTLDLNTFFQGLTCGGTTTPIVGEQTGPFTLNPGSGGESGHAFIVFFFTHNNIKHSLELHGTITDLNNWLPDPNTSNSMTELPKGNGAWLVKAQGKNNKNGCTGEGNGLTYTATVDAK